MVIRNAMRTAPAAMPRKRSISSSTITLITRLRIRLTSVRAMAIPTIRATKLKSPAYCGSTRVCARIHSVKGVWQRKPV